MDTRLIEYMIALQEEKSITRAAKRMFITPSALSQQLKGLEQEIGAPLFVRNGRQMELSAVGKLYLSGARAVMAVKTRAMTEMAAVRDAKGELGVLRVALHHDFLEFFRHSICPQFAKICPPVRLEAVVVTDTPAKMEVVEGRADLAFVIGSGITATSLGNIPIRKEELHLAFAPEALLGGGMRRAGAVADGAGSEEIERTGAVADGAGSEETERAGAVADGAGSEETERAGAVANGAGSWEIERAGAGQNAERDLAQAVSLAEKMEMEELATRLGHLGFVAAPLNTLGYAERYYLNRAGLTAKPLCYATSFPNLCYLLEQGFAYGLVPACALGPESRLVHVPLEPAAYYVLEIAYSHSLPMTDAVKELVLLFLRIFDPEQGAQSLLDAL